MADRIVKAGDTITLRAYFKDDVDLSVDASNVTISIYPPNTKLETVNIFQAGIPTYFDNGIFEYKFTTPSNGPDGSWQDVWYGTLPAQTVSGVFSFDVSAKGEVDSFTNQLYANNLVEITLASGIYALDGSVSDEYYFSFMAVTTPTYSNTRKVRLEYGGFLQDLGEDVLQQSLLEASLEADELTFEKNHQNLKFFQHARREWVTCRASLMLLMNLGNTSLRSKSLGDFSVAYDTNAIRDAMQKAVECINKWEPEVMSAGNYKANQQPQGVVKGEFDIDKPAIGRSWSTGLTYWDNRFPAANCKTRTLGQRRWSNIFSDMRRRYW